MQNFPKFDSVGVYPRVYSYDKKLSGENVPIRITNSSYLSHIGLESISVISLLK
jgi:hypothetical protein